MSIPPPSHSGSIYRGATREGDFIVGFDWDELGLVDPMEKARHWLRAALLNESLAHGKMRAVTGPLKARARRRWIEMHRMARAAEREVERLRGEDYASSGD